MNALFRIQPELRTRRLCLRPFRDDDTARLAVLAGARRIADTTISVPHPYSVAQAVEDIRRFREAWQAGTAGHFAIAFPPGPSAFVGHIALRDIDWEHLTAELSFWIDEPASGNGYVAEAGNAMLRFAFDELKLNRIYAYHMVRNTASARVLTRLGMREEGILRQRVRKWGIFEDVRLWAILREDAP